MTGGGGGEFSVSLWVVETNFDFFKTSKPTLVFNFVLLSEGRNLSGRRLCYRRRAFETQ